MLDEEAIAGLGGEEVGAAPVGLSIVDDVPASQDAVEGDQSERADDGQSVESGSVAALNADHAAEKKGKKRPLPIVEKGAKPKSKQKKGLAGSEPKIGTVPEAQTETDGNAYKCKTAKRHTGPFRLNSKQPRGRPNVTVDSVIRPAATVLVPVGEIETNPEPVGREVVFNDPLSDDEVIDEPVGEEIVNDEPIDEVVANDEPVDEVAASDKPIDQATDFPVSQANVGENPIVSAEATDQPVGESAVLNGQIEVYRQDQALAFSAKLSSIERVPGKKKKVKKQRKSKSKSGTKKKSNPKKVKLARAPKPSTSKGRTTITPEAAVIAYTAQKAIPKMLDISLGKAVFGPTHALEGELSSEWNVSLRSSNNVLLKVTRQSLRLKSKQPSEQADNDSRDSYRDDDYVNDSDEAGEGTPADEGRY